MEALKELLPGANCGACGYSGCEGYAHAMVHEGAKVGLCSPGGAKVAEATGALLGVSGEVEVKTALVRCGGCLDVTARKLNYRGLPSCKAAAQFYGGDWLCGAGCLGYGDCVDACEFDAIHVEKRPGAGGSGPLPCLRPVCQSLPQASDRAGPWSHKRRGALFQP